MTNEQRERITSLRHQGFGYTAIANAVGLSKDSVKAFCRKHELSGVRAESNARIDISQEHCLNCGKPLMQTEGVKKKKFCSDICRVTWWNAHPEKVSRRAVYEFVCPQCHKPFTAYGNAKRKYCSHTCYVTARFKGGDTNE